MSNRLAYYDAIEARILTSAEAARSALEGIRALKAMEVAPTSPTAPPVAPPVAIPAAPTTGLLNPQAFFDDLRAGKLLGPVLTQEEVNGCAAIAAACTKERLPLSHAAYCFATAYHEVSGTMQPIHERGGTAYLHRMYDIEGSRPDKARELGNLSPGDGVKYAGRGYPQLTGKRNYQKAQDETGIQFVAQPDLMLRIENAALVMARGMKHGWFTTKKLVDYLPAPGPATKAQFRNARRIVNGLDRADDIAGYALEFQDSLQKGQWT